MSYEKDCKKHDSFISVPGCPVDICEEITIKVPVTVCAHSEVCEVTFKCLGHTIENECDGKTDNNGCNRFKIVQKIQVRIPLKFIATVDVDEGEVTHETFDCVYQ